jgi:phosphoglycerol transferase MdoB-like AlkP superfamily enzyme
VPLRILRFFLSYLVIPNLTFFVIGYFFYGIHPLLNLDYVVLGLLSQNIRRPPAILSYVSLLIVDVIGMFAPVFYFDWIEAIFASTYIFYFNDLFTFGMVIIVFIAMTILGTIAVAISHALGRPRTPEVFILVAGIGLLIAGDVVNGTSKFSSYKQEQKVFFSYNLAGSGLYKLVSEGVHALEQKRGQANVILSEKVDSATITLRTSLDTFGASNIVHVVLVIVESLGILENQHVMNHLMSPFFQSRIQERYRVQIRQIPFGGSTTTAEFRELCGVKMSYTDSRQDSLRHCLPWSLHRRGFRTVAMHGFSRNMFSRSKWYPLLGFERIWFAEDMFASGYTGICGGAFRGFCDTAVAQLLRDEMLRAPEHERRFVYWLTLNSHLPIDEASVGSVNFECGDFDVFSQFRDVCLLTKVHYGIFSAIAEIATDPTLPLTHFILVGDHSPHFFRQEKRRLFVQGKVPVIELTPRSEIRNGNLP